MWRAHLRLRWGTGSGDRGLDVRGLGRPHSGAPGAHRLARQSVAGPWDGQRDGGELRALRLPHRTSVRHEGRWRRVGGPGGEHQESGSGPGHEAELEQVVFVPGGADFLRCETGVHCGGRVDGNALRKRRKSSRSARQSPRKPAQCQARNFPFSLPTYLCLGGARPDELVVCGS